MSREIISTQNAPKAIGTYSQAVKIRTNPSSPVKDGTDRRRYACPDHTGV